MSPGSYLYLDAFVIVKLKQPLPLGRTGEGLTSRQKSNEIAHWFFGEKEEILKKERRLAVLSSALQSRAMFKIQ